MDDFRKSHFIKAKYEYPVSNTPYIGSVFIIKTVHSETKFANIFWNKLTPEFVSIGLTFSSKDGEYRQYLYNEKTLQATFDNISKSDEYQELEMSIIKLVENKIIQLDCHIYTNELQIKDDISNIIIDEERINNLSANGSNNDPKKVS